MQYLEFIGVRHDTGAALPNGKITVKLAGTSTLATVYDSSGGTITQPVSADINGVIGFAAANGAYDLYPTSADGAYIAPTIHKVQLYDLTALDAQVTAVGISATNAHNSELAAAASAVTAAAGGFGGPNGSAQRWLALVAAAGGSAPTATQNAARQLEYDLATSGFLAKIAHLNMFWGTSGTPAFRIPFYQRPGVGNASYTGTAPTFTESAGLAGTSFTLDTGATLQQAKMNLYDLFIGGYLLMDPTGTDFGPMFGGASSTFQFYPCQADGTALAQVFDYSSRLNGDTSRKFNQPSPNTLQTTKGLMVAQRRRDGRGLIYLKGAPLPENALSSPTLSPIEPTDNICVKFNGTAGAGLGAFVMGNALTDGEQTALAWIIHSANVNINRGVVAEGYTYA